MLLRAAEDRGLDAPAVRLLICCYRLLDAVSFRTLKVTAVATDLDLRRETVRKALRALVAGGYLEAGPAVSQVGTYRLVGVPAGAPGSKPSTIAARATGARRRVLVSSSL